MSATVIAPAEHIAYAGRTMTLLQLQDIGNFTVGQDIHATCVSPDKLFIVAVEQNGLVHILQRCGPDHTQVAHHSVFSTKYRNACFVAIDNEAKSILLIDNDDRCHVFWSYGREWLEEPKVVTIGLIKHAAHTFKATLEDEPDEDTVAWKLHSSIHKQTYRLTRYPRWISWWRGFIWLPY